MTMADQLRIDLRLVTVRPITEADYPFLYQLYASTRAEEMALLDWPEAEKRHFLTMQFWAQHTYYQKYYDGATFQVLEFEGQPIGRLYVHRGPTEIRIVDIALLPAYRNYGLGTYFLKQLLNEAEQVHKIVTIHVEHFNPALQLYERLGFKQIDTNGVYYLMAWQAN